MGAMTYRLAALLTCAATLSACAYGPGYDYYDGSPLSAYEGVPCRHGATPLPGYAAPPCASEYLVGLPLHAYSAPQPAPALRQAPVAFAPHSVEVETACCFGPAPLAPPAMAFAPHSVEVQTVCCFAPEPEPAPPPAPLPQYEPEPAPLPLPPVVHEPAPPVYVPPPPMPQSYPEPEFTLPPLRPYRK